MKHSKSGPVLLALLVLITAAKVWVLNGGTENRANVLFLVRLFLANTQQSVHKVYLINIQKCVVNCGMWVGPQFFSSIHQHDLEANKVVLAKIVHFAAAIVGHLTDEQRNRITNLSAMLANQAASVKFFDCENESGVPDNICLIYVPQTEHAICETVHNSPKAWLRQGAQNILMNQSQRDQLRRDKKICDFEQAYCCPYSPNDIDQAILRVFRKSYPSLYGYDTEEFLYQIGALTKDDQGYAFTKRRHKTHAGRNGTTSFAHT